MTGRVTDADTGTAQRQHSRACHSDRTTIDVQMQPDRVAPQQVTVTAQRREQRLQQVPVSVAAASGPTLAGLQTRGSDICDELFPV